MKCQILILAHRESFPGSEFHYYGSLIRFSDTQGLFERHKLIVATQLCVAILKHAGLISPAKLNYLFSNHPNPAAENPVSEWIAEPIWVALQALKVRIRTVSTIRIQSCS